jgi:hypothetical protein
MTFNDGPNSFKKNYDGEAGRKIIEDCIEGFKVRFGAVPSVYCFSGRSIGADYFPAGMCEALSENGVIPLIRYYIQHNVPNFEGVAKGEYDNNFRLFAMQAALFGKPFIITPWPEVNITSLDDTHPWSKSSSTHFRLAYKRMKNIFNQMGAINASFGLHLLAGGHQKPYSDYTLDDADFDWVGFTANNYSLDVPSLVLDGYNWARKHYPSKPVALFEYAILKSPSQSQDLQNHLEGFKKLSALKLVVCAQFEKYIKSTGGFRSSVLNEDSARILGEKSRDSYYIWAK